MPNVIGPCSCLDPYQDKVYGKGQRVHTLGKKVKVCTKCGTKK